MAKNDKTKAKASAPAVNERYKRMEALRKLFPGAVKDLAKTLGITEQEYYTLENTLPGAIKPAYIIDIAHYYGVSVAYMLGFTQNEGAFEGTPEKINEMRSCNLLSPWAPNVFAATKVFGSAAVEKSVKSVEKAGKETAKKVEKPVEKAVAPVKPADKKDTEKAAKAAETTTEPTKRKYTRHQAWPTPAEAAALAKRKEKQDEKKAAAMKPADVKPAAVAKSEGTKKSEPIKATVEVATPVVKLTNPAPIIADVIAEAKVDPNSIPLTGAEAVMQDMSDEQGIAPTAEDNSIKDAVMSRMLENVAQTAPYTAAPIAATEPENKEIEVTLNLKLATGTKMTINIDATSGVAVIK